MWLRFGFEMRVCPPHPLALPTQMPRWKYTLSLSFFLSAILRRSLVPLFLQNPITKDSFHRGERAIRGLSLQYLLPFKKVDVEDR